MKLFNINKQEKKTPSIDALIEKKLVLFVSIVNEGQSRPIIKIMEKCGSSAQFIETGEGTARKEIRNILGIEDNNKEIIFSFVTNDRIPEIKNYLDIYFSTRTKNAGIGFSIPLTSIVGVKVYQFLADTIKED
ncbi:MAG: hypothetical protein MJ221_00885 [Bacilli bacterium]|nr:hypothetical protein [Bacilli bacterium]